MKKIICIFLFSAVAGILCSAAVPVDFGIDIKNTTGLTRNGSRTCTHKDPGSLWFSAQPNPVLKYAFQGSYTFDLDRYYLFELDLAKIEANMANYGKLPFLLNIQGGRFYFSDFTGKVLGHNVDGFRVKLGLPFIETIFSIGHTGLSNKVGSDIIMSKADLADRSDDSVFLSSPRILEMITVKFPELFLRQQLTVAAVFQQDIRAQDNLAQEGDTVYSSADGGLLHTQYFGIGFSGPIVGALYYKTYGYLGTGRTLSYIDGAYTNTAIISGLCGAELTLFLPKALQSKIGLSFLYSSGDADYSDFTEGNTAGYANQYIPVSRPAIATTFSPQLGNIFYGAVSYSYKPLSYMGNAFGNNFQIKVKGIPMFRSTSAPISESGLNPSSTALYLGTEVDGVVNFRILSDLGLSLTAGFFMPNIWAFTDNSVRALAKMELSISM